MTHFDHAIAVTHSAEQPGAATARIDAAFQALRGALGGYLAAIAVEALAPLLGDRSVRTVSTTFLRPTNEGEVQVEVRTLHAGRSIGRHEVSLVQDGRQVAAVRITAVSPVSGVEWDHGVPPDVAPLAENVPFDPPEGVIHFRQATAVLDPASLPFTHQDVVRLGGHVRPLEPRPIDAAWLVMVLDWFPPSPFVKVDPPTGGVSIDYAVHIHHTIARPLADDEWLSADFRAEVSADGLALEHGRIADSTGRLLAESFHTRWTA